MTDAVTLEAGSHVAVVTLGRPDHPGAWSGDMAHGAHQRSRRRDDVLKVGRVSDGRVEGFASGREKRAARVEGT